MIIKKKDTILFWARVFKYLSNVNWILYFIIIAFPFLPLISNRINSFILLFPLIVASVIIYFSIKEAVFFVYSIEVNQNNLLIKYSKYNKQKKWTSAINKTQFKTRHPSPKGPTKSHRIHFINENKKRLTMYFNGYWTVQDMIEIESKLIEQKIRRPYGENL
jgi:uncharacterized protein YxeA